MKIQIQPMLRLNKQQLKLDFVVNRNSNTTNVKVKYIKFFVSLYFIDYSNTTNVKVKSPQLQKIFLNKEIQIQPMLRLNYLLWYAGNAPATNSNTTNVKVKSLTELKIKRHTPQFKYNQC